MLAYQAAVGNDAEVRALLDSANAPTAGPHVSAYCHRIALGVLLNAQRASGAMPGAEVRGWREWSEQHRAVDAVLDADDWRPTAVEVVNRFSGYLRHPRSFLRSVVLDR